MNTTLQLWANKQKAVWEEKLGFPATPAHLEFWASMLNRKLGLIEYLEELSVDDLTPAWKEGGKKKETNPPPLNHGTAQLKAVWRRTMDFTPKPWHLHYFQLHLDAALGIDRYFDEVTIEQLIDVVRTAACQSRDLTEQKIAHDKKSEKEK